MCKVLLQDILAVQYLGCQAAEGIVKTTAGGTRILIVC